MTSARIMIVEDEAVVAMDLESRLKHLSYEVAAVASSKADAVKAAESARPDLVLMDINLQGRPEGIGAAREIGERFGIPCIFVTAYADDATLNEAKLTAPMGYIVKPFSDRELRAAIEVGLYRHKMETALQESRRELEQRVRELTALNELFRNHLKARFDSEQTGPEDRLAFQRVVSKIREIADNMDPGTHNSPNRN